MAKVGTASQTGTSGMSTSENVASPMRVTMKPARTNRSVDQRSAPRAWIQEPAVHEMVAAVRAIPAAMADRPRWSSRVSET